MMYNETLDWGDPSPPTDNCLTQQGLGKTAISSSDRLSYDHARKGRPKYQPSACGQGDTKHRLPLCCKCGRAIQIQLQYAYEEGNS